MIRSPIKRLTSLALRFHRTNKDQQLTGLNAQTSLSIEKKRQAVQVIFVFLPRRSQADDNDSESDMKIKFHLKIGRKEHNMLWNGHAATTQKAHIIQAHATLAFPTATI